MNIFQRFAVKSIQMIAGKSLNGAFMRGGDDLDRQDGFVTMTDADNMNAYADSSWVYACVSRIMSDIASLNLVIKDRKTKKNVENHDALALLQKPCSFMTQYDFMEFLIASLELSGDFFAGYDQINTATKEPKSLFPFYPAAISVIGSTEAGKIVERYEYAQTGGKKIIPVEQMLQLKYYNPKPNGYLTGLSPLSAASMAYQTDKQASIWNINAITNGTALDVVLETDKDVPDEKVRTEMIQSFTQKYAGARNARKPALLANGVKAKSLSLSPKDVEFLNQRKLTREEICTIYRVPPALVGIFEYANYANSEQQEKFYWKNGIKPRCTKIAGLLTLCLLSRFKKSENHYFEYDLSEIAALQDDELSKIKTAREYMACGVPYNDIAKEMNLKVKEIKGGNVGFIPFSMQPIASVMSENEPATEPQKGARCHKDKKKIVCKGGMSELQMSIKWNAFVALAGSFESRMKPVIRSFFSMQQLDVEANLEAQKSVKDITVDIDKILFDSAEANKDFVKRIKPIVRQIIKDQAALEINNFDFGISFELENPRVGQWIEKYGLNEAVNINETTKNALRETLKEGIAAGEGIPDLAKRISATYEDAKGYRADNIARTETIAASNQANVETYKQVEEQTGAKIRKAWLNAEDERTRESHMKAGMDYDQSHAIGTEEDFYVGAGHGAAPAQIGRPEEDINCRCSVMPVIEE
jgi:HK97 family phage portal protein